MMAPLDTDEFLLADAYFDLRQLCGIRSSLAVRVVWDGVWARSHDRPLRNPLGDKRARRGAGSRS